MKHVQKTTRLFLCLGFLMGMGTFAFTQGWLSPILRHFTWFEISIVELEVESPLTEKQVRQRLPLLVGRNLIQLQPKALIAGLKKWGWVRSVVVQKRYPDRLRLIVHSKTPNAIWLKKGVPYFVDGSGVLGRVPAHLLRQYDLPSFSFAKKVQAQWPIPEVVRMLGQLQTKLKGAELSQMVLQHGQRFKLYLSRPQLEVQLNKTNWQSQIPVLTSLIQSPPDVALRRVNLVYSKKAIVSPDISN